MTGEPTTHADREDRMLLKIEQFRKRRPRLIDGSLRDHDRSPAHNG